MIRVSKDCQVVLVCQEILVQRVILDLQEFQVFQVQKELLASQALRVSEVTKVFLDLKVYKAHQAHQVLFSLLKGILAYLAL